MNFKLLLTREINTILTVIVETSFRTESLEMQNLMSHPDLLPQDLHFKSPGKYCSAAWVSGLPIR